MDRLTCASGSICFILLLDVANADGDLHKRLRKKPVDYTLTAIMVSSFLAFLIVVSCVIFWCTWWCRRHRGLGMLQPTPCVPPSLSPAPGPVVSGVPTYVQPETHPLVPGASTSLTTLSTQQKGFQEDRSPPYPKGGSYYDHSGTSLPQLPTAPMPPQPPPPYGY